MRQISTYFLASVLSIGCTSASAQTWTTLGSGFDAQVNALTVFNSELYAAGVFTTAGGNAANKVAKWNGTSWAPLGTVVTFPPSALAIHSSALYAGYNTGNYVYKLNGTSWTTTGPGGALDIFAMASYGSELFTGGASQVNKYNGISWATPIPVTGGTATNGAHVSAFATYGSDLYAGGNFGNIGGVSANSIAKWNGTAWTAVGTGITGTTPLTKVSAMAVFNGDLYVAGNFATAGGVTAQNIAKWNGTTWSAVGGGLNGPVSALQVHNGKLYVGGNFNFASPWNVQNLAMWDGAAWKPVGPGTDNTVRALAEFNNKLIVAGSFTFAGGAPANFIAQYNECTAPPAPPGAITGSDTVCAGANESYQVPFAVGMSYTWTLPPGWTGTSTDFSITAVGGTSGNVSVSTVNACGTSTPVTFAVLGFPTPTAIVSASGPVAFCPGGSVTLTTPLVTGQTYQWRRNNQPVNGATTNSYNATTAGNYVVRVSNGVCTATSTPAQAVTIHPAPTTPTFTISGNTLTTTAVANSYQWFFNGGPVTGATLSSHTATQSGSYYVKITDGNGCTAQSAAQTVTVVGIDDVSILSGVQIFPNPNDGVFTLKWTGRSSEGNVSVEVRDITGKLVFSDNIMATGSVMEKTLNLAHLPSGAYAVRVISDNNSTVHSMIRK